MTSEYKGARAGSGAALAVGPRPSGVSVERQRGLIIRHRQQSSQKRAAFAFLLPFGVLFVLFFILPIIYAIYESLITVKHSGVLGFGPVHEVFAKADNYLQAVINNGSFTSALVRVLLFGAVEVPLMIGLSLVLALILESASARFRPLFRTAYFAPYGVPGAIGSLLWAFLYTPGLSPIVSLLNGTGLHIDFLSSNLSLWSVANIVTWEFAGYNMLIIIAQLQAVPRELYEAARVDGARGPQIAWHIQIPFARPALVLTAVFTIIGTLQLFTEPLVLQTIDANISSSYTPQLSVYSEAFVNNNYNYAAAQAAVTAVAALVLSFTFLKLAHRWSGLR